jgi:preprotein translocase subunit SecY
MITQIKNFIQEKQEKITKIALITIAVIILLIIFSIQVQSYIKISKAKQELIQEEKTKNEYTLKLIN